MGVTIGASRANLGARVTNAQLNKLGFSHISLIIVFGWELCCLTVLNICELEFN